MEAAAPLVWQPALTATEVRMERDDKAHGRHWLWAGDCWCKERHRAGEGLALVRPPWDSARGAESIAAVAS